MEFLVIGMDGTDEEAFQRRSGARQRHLETVRSLKEKGNALFGAALLDGDGRMVGSMLVLSFTSRQELDAYLAGEPYVTDGVWEKIEVRQCLVPDIFKT